MLVVGHVMKQQISQKYRNFLLKKSNEWCKRHKVKAFYSLVDDNDFESGSRALLQATGIGKLRPNILLMGFKNDWRTCDQSELEKYFNVVHKAFDLYLAVAILRVPNGLDYSHILGDDAPKHIKEAPKTLPSNDSSTDLTAREKNCSVDGSCDSLSRNMSQGTYMYTINYHPKVIILHRQLQQNYQLGFLKHSNKNGSAYSFEFCIHSDFIKSIMNLKPCLL